MAAGWFMRQLPRRAGRGGQGAAERPAVVGHQHLVNMRQLVGEQPVELILQLHHGGLPTRPLTHAGAPVGAERGALG